MGFISLRESDFTIDVEAGRNVSEEDGHVESITQVKKMHKFLRFNETINGDDLLITCKSGGLNPYVVSVGNLGSLEGNYLGEEKVSKDAKRENRRNKGCKMSSKPPRHPKPPKMTASDVILVRELTELAMLKQARIEQRKALEKMKATKITSSISSNLFSMVITVVFCLIMICQGGFSQGSSNAYFNCFPKSAVEMMGELISVQYYGASSARSSYSPDRGSDPPDIIKQVSGGGVQDERGQTL